MDFTKEIAELEALVRMVATAARLKHAYTAEAQVQRKIAEWRQTTYHTLETVANEHYEMGRLFGSDSEQSGIVGEPQ